MDAMTKLKNEIVEVNQSITLFEKLDANDFFEPIMNRYNIVNELEQG